ncbi:MAG: hypothetical protein LQ343_001981 [Gyalolechia ehrenbergii]|nr:MAG: hypothetical protein LQ343_001981 [Gyalolechia ehrenbergii]
MKETTETWIVTPIIRAVDNGTASSLLEDTFRPQRRLDNGFSSVAFICTKTDHYDVRDIEESLSLEDELALIRGEIWELEEQQKTWGLELRALDDPQMCYNEAIHKADQEGFVPQLQIAQKPEGTEQKLSRKRQRPSSDSDTDSVTGKTKLISPSDNEGTCHMHQKTSAPPVGKEEFGIKAAETRNTKHNNDNSKLNIEINRTSIREKQEKARLAHKELNAKLIARCISERNQYSKNTMQQNYAALIERYGSEVSGETETELPVFCVSSSGYRSLKDQMWTDSPDSCFRDLEETGIPVLQKRCVKATEGARITVCHRFLNNLSQLLNSLALWASGNTICDEMPQEQMERRLASSMEAQRADIHNTLEGNAKELRRALLMSIFNKFEPAVNCAKNKATDTSQRWAESKKTKLPGQGGYGWSTFKAICRRDGVYTYRNELHNWNEALAAPMIGIILPGWEKMFSRDLPTIMESFTRSASKILTDYHREIDHEARKFSINKAGLAMLLYQTGGYTKTLELHAKSVRKAINSAQKDINRQFIPVIQTAMKPAYEYCNKDHGAGISQRMRNRVLNQVEDSRHSMFQKSVNQARESLLDLIAVQEKNLADSVNEVFRAFRRDCESVLTRRLVPGEAEARQRRRHQIMEVLDTSEEIFRNVINPHSSDESIDNITSSTSVVDARMDCLPKVEGKGLQEIPVGSSEIVVKRNGTQIPRAKAPTSKVDASTNIDLLDILQSSQAASCLSVEEENVDLGSA